MLSVNKHTFLDAGFLGDVFDAGFCFALAEGTRVLVDLGADLAAFLALAAVVAPVTV